MENSEPAIESGDVPNATPMEVDESHVNPAFEPDSESEPKPQESKSASNVENDLSDKPKSDYLNTAEVEKNVGLDDKTLSNQPDEPNTEKFIENGLSNGTDDGDKLSRPKTIWTPTEKDLSNGSLKDVEMGEGGEAGRDVWDNPIEFLLSCISMSVGLGNVWRFPFTALKNGGGAFLIPYLIVLIFIGRPIYYLEMCLGQFSRSGQVKVWAMAPLFKGVGYGSMIGTICVVSYYCSIMAQTVFYFFSSFAKDLPWSYCNKDWGENYCHENETVNNEFSNKSSSGLYYELEAFPVYSNIDDGLGAPEWRLSLCLLLSWMLVFFSLVKGVKSSGKVAYFTAIFPYVVILILLVRGATLNGAWEGIKYFITPQWDQIYEPKVWYAAVGQCFFSLATGFGPIIMFSSYNPFSQNVYKDALIVSVMDTLTSLLAGCTIFSVLGFLSAELNVPIEDVTTGGPGLAFVSYPEAIAQFDWVPQLFAVLFFLMLFTLGIGSATSLTGGIITIICDQFPKWRRWLVTLIVCIVGFFAGLMYVTPGGNFMVEFVDFFGANFVIYVMAMVEVGAVAWVYGVNNFSQDIEFMLHIKVGWYWKFCWGFFIPVGLFGVLIYTMATMDRLTYDKIPYPDVAIICGWILAAFALLLLPLWAIQAVYTRKGNGLKEKFLEALRPTKDWGPKDPKIRAEWIEFKKNY